MNNKHELIYEGKAKKVFSHDDADKVIIEFKDEIILDETEHFQPNFNLDNREEAKQFHINLVENAVKAINAKESTNGAEERI